MIRPEALPEKLVDEFVLAAHLDFARVKELVEHYPALLTACDAQGESALSAAAHSGNRETVQFLVQCGAPHDIFTATVLGLKDRMASFLKEDPGLVNAKGEHDTTLIYYAAMSGDPTVVEFLISQGGGEGVKRALHAATRFGHLEMAKWLLAHGADTTLRNYRCCTPLEVAVEKDYRDLADLLRKHIGPDSLERCSQCQQSGYRFLTRIEGHCMWEPHTTYFQCNYCGADMGSQHYAQAHPPLDGK